MRSFIRLATPSPSTSQRSRTGSPCPGRPMPGPGRTRWTRSGGGASSIATDARGLPGYRGREAADCAALATLPTSERRDRIDRRSRASLEPQRVDGEAELPAAEATARGGELLEVAVVN